MMNKFQKGEIVVCIINSRASLTVGKEYTVYGQDDRYDEVLILNDNGYKSHYNDMRFISKTEFREYIIEQIIQ